MSPEEIFTTIFANVDGYKVYNAGKRTMDAKDTANLIYGEMPFTSNAEIFNIIKDEVKPGDTFYDLGSGIGRILVCAALLLPNLSSIIGVELVKSLNEATAPNRNFQSLTTKQAIRSN